MNDSILHLAYRQRVYVSMNKWYAAGLITGQMEDNNSSYLWWLLRNVNHQCFNPGSLMTDNEIKLCEALAGPNGWAVHQMLLAQTKRKPFKP